ncbi:MAG: GAF and ANTAR domain-containing protein [Candidatus Omnitrophica bacterium]|nr:GAF and ANTAR domain-containing protein [Candidatus Omnitrophota bacterium]
MKQTSDYLVALNKISQAITSDLYIEDILKLIVNLTASMMNAKICAVWLLEEKTKELKIRATQAMSQEYLKERSLKIGEGIVGLVAQERKAISILDVTLDKRYKEKELAKKESLVSMLSVPMLVKDEVIGVMSCYTTKEYAFTKKDIDLFSTVANQAAVAMHNTELLIKTRIIQEELESRKKIEKAKGILMKTQGINEDKAYNVMRKASMDKRVNMKEIAEAIILAYEIQN